MEFELRDERASGKKNGVSLAVFRASRQLTKYLNQATRCDGPSQDNILLYVNFFALVSCLLYDKQFKTQDNISS